MTKLTTKLLRTIYVLAAVAVVAVGVWVWQAVQQTQVSIGVDDRINVTPEQVERIKAIGEWEFLSVADEEMVDTVRKGFFTDDHLVRIYYGTLRLGIDLSNVQAGWLATEGDSLVATLPAVKLLSNDFIDEARTKSFHESGQWTARDREALYAQAHRKMRARCLTAENLRLARLNGEEQFRRLLRTLGFERVSIRWEHE